LLVAAVLSHRLLIRSDMMRVWMFKKLLTFLLRVLDSWVTGELTVDRALMWRRCLESVTIGRAMKLEQRPYWKKKKSNNAFAKFMTVLLKSNRLDEFRKKNEFK